MLSAIIIITYLSMTPCSLLVRWFVLRHGDYVETNLDLSALLIGWLFGPLLFARELADGLRLLWLRRRAQRLYGQYVYYYGDAAFSSCCPQGHRYKLSRCEQVLGLEMKEGHVLLRTTGWVCPQCGPFTPVVVPRLDGKVPEVYRQAYPTKT